VDGNEIVRKGGHALRNSIQKSRKIDVLLTVMYLVWKIDVLLTVMYLVSTFT
jgi:hypothetical protein